MQASHLSLNSARQCSEDQKDDGSLKELLQSLLSKATAPIGVAFAFRSVGLPTVVCLPLVRALWQRLGVACMMHRLYCACAHRHARCHHPKNRPAKPMAPLASTYIECKVFGATHYFGGDVTQ